jgi:hypothetical protein
VQPQERCVWQTDGWAYVGMFFVVFVMFWTNSIIGEIKRYTVCGAIGLWCRVCLCLCLCVCVCGVCVCVVCKVREYWVCWGTV